MSQIKKISVWFLIILISTFLIISWDKKDIPSYDPWPSGIITPYAGTTAPLGYLLCDGSAINRTTYAALFAIISTTYGSGDGSTTFNLPDLRQRFPLGKAASGTGSTLGGTGGVIDHLHTADPASTATSSDGSHNHTGATGTPSSTVAATNLTGTAASTTHTHSISTDGAHTHNVDISSFNTGTANPPFISLNFIIKY
jgi:microcystin-dependent protein